MADLLDSCEFVHGHIGRVCFKTGPPGTVGVELEWLVLDQQNPSRPVPLARTLSALASVLPIPEPENPNSSTHDPTCQTLTLPLGTRVTFEPGGQLELSSRRLPDLDACYAEVSADVHTATQALAIAGLCISDSAVDPFRPPRRQVDHPRYAAMESYLDRRGSIGRIMMCSTASVQVCLDVGADETDARRRWQVLHAIGPTMVAAFANSAIHNRRDSGWRSLREAVWLSLDPTRTQAPPGAGLADTDPVTSWADYTLDAPVMALRSTDGPWDADPGLSLRQWVTGHCIRPGGGPLPWPTDDDLEFHLTTLFPPVRPRGWLEVRYLDAQPAGYWPVPMAVLTALVEDPVASERALAATAAVTGPDAWLRAARHGLSDPDFAAAATQCFDAARSAMDRLSVGPELCGVVDQFMQRYVSRGRCPADDQLDAYTRSVQGRTSEAAAHVEGVPA